MSRIRMAALAAVFFAQFGVAGFAQAGFEVMTYEGSRDDVRAYCVGEGRTLTEHPDYTLCQDEMTGANHIGKATTGASDIVVTGGIAPRVPIPGVDVAPTSEILPKDSRF
jgi:hypothetical protein